MSLLRLLAALVVCFVSVPAIAQDVAQARRLIQEALALLDRAYPELAGELRALLREIVLAVGPDAPDANNFDGASAFMLWGAILLNARNRSSVLEMAPSCTSPSRTARIRTRPRR